MSDTVSIRAPAKVNLRLAIRDRRPDGFHDIETLFQAIDLCDEVTVQLGGQGVSLSVEGADVGPSRENLAYRAAVAYQEVAGQVFDVSITLHKKIPAGAGLGGGSSDAAAVLRAMARLSGGAVPSGDLMGIAADLGSDVPFFLSPTPLALGRGRGEVLTSFEPLPQAGVVVVSPPVHVATGPAYSALAAIREGLSPAVSVEAFERPDSWSEAVQMASNDFESIVASLYPEVQLALDALGRAGAPLVMLAGSGGACFALVEGEGAAEDVAERVEAELGWLVHASRTLAAWDELSAT